MIASRLIAWAAVIAIVYGCYAFISDWKNPWSVSTVNLIPTAPDGCMSAPIEF